MPVQIDDTAQSADIRLPSINVVNPPAITASVDLENTTFGGLISQMISHRILIADSEQINIPTRFNPEFDCAQYDGHFVGKNNIVYPLNTSITNIPEIPPDGAKAEDLGKKIIYVNGMCTPLEEALAESRAVANKKLSPVICLYNAQENDYTDFFQSVGDKCNFSRNAAVETLTRIIVNAAQENSQLSLNGESQGALIISRALACAKVELFKSGMNEAEILKAFSQFDVETTGGAAWSYTDGPRYVHYVCRQDPVAFYCGLTTYGLSKEEIAKIELSLAKPQWAQKASEHVQLYGIIKMCKIWPGSNARIVSFDIPPTDNWCETHDILTYLKHNRPFEIAYTESVSIAAK